jgi:hypothetical protein
MGRTRPAPPKPRSGPTAGGLDGVDLYRASTGQIPPDLHQSWGFLFLFVVFILDLWFLV